MARLVWVKLNGTRARSAAEARVSEQWVTRVREVMFECMTRLIHLLLMDCYPMCLLQSLVGLASNTNGLLPVLVEGGLGSSGRAGHTIGMMLLCVGCIKAVFSGTYHRCQLSWSRRASALWADIW